MAKGEQRMKFETNESIARAVRIRAGLDGVTQGEVINAALKVYLAKEIAQAQERIQAETVGGKAEGSTQPPKRKKDLT
jgi:hypothetical protein